MSQLASNLLVQVIASKLEDYVEDFDASQMQFHGGVLTLQNVQLKREALNGLNLPIRLKSGRVGSFVLRVNLQRIIIGMRVRASAVGGRFAHTIHK